MADDAQPAECSPAESDRAVSAPACSETATGEGTAGARFDLPALVADHAALLYRYAYRLTGSAADAEDLTQQTFLIAHQKLAQLRDAESVRGWLFAVLRRVFFKEQKKSRPERLAHASFDVENIPQEVVDHWSIDGELLQTVIGELPEPYKLVLLSYYFDDLSYREIAEQFALPVGTVMSRLSRAKNHLRSRLIEAEYSTGVGQSAASRTRGDER